jgi:hypothetical protein
MSRLVVKLVRAVGIKKEFRTAILPMIPGRREIHDQRHHMLTDSRVLPRSARFDCFENLRIRGLACGTDDGHDGFATRFSIVPFWHNLRNDATKVSEAQQATFPAHPHLMPTRRS